MLENGNNTRSGNVRVAIRTLIQGVAITGLLAGLPWSQARADFPLPPRIEGWRQVGDTIVVTYRMNAWGADPFYDSPKSIRVRWSGPKQSQGGRDYSWDGSGREYQYVIRNVRPGPYVFKIQALEKHDLRSDVSTTWAEIRMFVKAVKRNWGVVGIRNDTKRPVTYVEMINNNPVPVTLQPGQDKVYALLYSDSDPNWVPELPVKWSPTKGSWKTSKLMSVVSSQASWGTANRFAFTDAGNGGLRLKQAVDSGTAPGRLIH